MPRDGSGSLAFNRTSSAQTLDSLDCTRTSDDPEKRYEERVSVLEFELREAKETIRSLRDQLTRASGVRDVQGPDSVSGLVMSEEFVKIPIKPHEERMLNFLINEYLLKNDYKITSVTFAEEVDNQDFDNWTDVGLNVSRPPDLLTIYRNAFAAFAARSPETQDAAVQTDGYLPSVDFDESLVDFQCLMNRLNEENAKLLERNQKLEEELELCRIDSNESKNASAALWTPGRFFLEKYLLESAESGSAESEQNLTRPKRLMADYLKRQLIADQGRLPCDFGLGKSSALASFNGQLDELVHVLAKLLPTLASKLSLRKREIILPLLAVTIIADPVIREREELCNLLFDLYKCPDVNQRRTIVNICAYMVSKMDSGRLETELLVPCVQRIDHPVAEQRSLAIEIVITMMPFISQPLLCSLIISILRQGLLGDSSQAVRKTAVLACSSLCCFVTDFDKFPTLCELFFAALWDRSGEVSVRAYGTFLSSLAVWALERRQLVEDLLRSIVEKMETAIENAGDVGSKGSDASLQNLHLCFRCLRVLSPLLLWTVLQDLDELQKKPDEPHQAGSTERNPVNRLPQVEWPLDDFSIYAPAEEVHRLVADFDQLTALEWHRFWPSLDFITRQLLHPVGRLLCSLDADDDELLKSAMAFFTHFARLFGSGFLEHKLYPMFKMISSNCKPDRAYCSLWLPIVAVALLSLFHAEADAERLKHFLSEAFTIIADGSLPVHSLVVTLYELSQSRPGTELIYESIEDVLSKSNASARRVCAVVASELLRRLSAVGCAERRLVPVLITLSNDAEPQVRLSTVIGLCFVSGSCANDAELVEKANQQLSCIFAEAFEGTDVTEWCELLQQVARIAATFEIRFLDHFFLPQLCRLTEKCVCRFPSSQGSLAALLPLLFDIYMALSCCCLSPFTVQSYFLPGLRYLAKELDPRRAKIAQSIVMEQEAKCGIQVLKHGIRTKNEF